MAHDQPVAPSVTGSETWDPFTPSATSENTTKNVSSSEIPYSCIPWPGRTFIIPSRKTGQVITFLDGELIMDKPGGLGTFRWRCVERNGWLGFRDPASGQYLGFHEYDFLYCRARHHKNNEYIRTRMWPTGGWGLLIHQGDRLRPLGVLANESQGGIKPRIKIMDWDAEDIVWDFTEVQS